MNSSLLYQINENAMKHKTNRIRKQTNKQTNLILDFDNIFLQVRWNHFPSVKLVFFFKKIVVNKDGMPKFSKNVKKPFLFQAKPFTDMYFQTNIHVTQVPFNHFQHEHLYKHIYTQSSEEDRIELVGLIHGCQALLHHVMYRDVS